ncbi:hypothetical protein FGB62_43g138 [Gracilaria domingensis]|nr:hypothetical protein FGB62_43g138 [Gracilaria domingensis]
MSAGKDPVESQVRAELEAEGINLDELLNGGKVVSLTRKLDALEKESETLSKGSEKHGAVQEKIDKIQKDITREKRQVMQTWLKQLFVFQALLFLAVGAVLSFDAVPGYSVPLVGQALGFWMTWLFTIPALRARKGTMKAEKSALNVSFLAIPLVNVCLPAVTRNCGLIWTADVAVLLGFYAFYFVRAYTNPQSGDGMLREQAAIKGVLKYLDWGSWR